MKQKFNTQTFDIIFILIMNIGVLLPCYFLIFSQLNCGKWEGLFVMVVFFLLFMETITSLILIPLVQWFMQKTQWHKNIFVIKILLYILNSWYAIFLFYSIANNLLNIFDIFCSLNIVPILVKCICLIIYVFIYKQINPAENANRINKDNARGTFHIIRQNKQYKKF
jgi:hypothetical protein